MANRKERTTQKVGDKYRVWHTEKFWESTKHQVPFDVELESLNHLDANCWFSSECQPTLRAVVEHFKRMEDADMSYPIILDPDGQLLDGAHRVARALANGQDSIKAVKLAEYPPPDEVVDSLTGI